MFKSGLTSEPKHCQGSQSKGDVQIPLSAVSSVPQVINLIGTVKSDCQIGIFKKYTCVHIILYCYSSSLSSIAKIPVVLCDFTVENFLSKSIPIPLVTVPLVSSVKLNSLSVKIQSSFWSQKS